jgi:hypothetical protein
MSSHVRKLKKTKNYHQPGKENGCVTRCNWKRISAWRWRCMVTGHDHVENSREYSIANEKDWYDLDFSVPGAARDRLDREVGRKEIYFRGLKKDPRKAQHKNAWWLTTGSNFQRTDKPWRFNAHHIIAVGSLHTYFLYEELRLLQQGKYNLHRGVNILMLPQADTYGRLYQLPTHPAGDSHKNYNSMVSSKLDSIKDKFDQQRAQAGQTGEHPRLTEDNVGNWGAELESFSKRVRGILRRLAVIKSGLDRSLKISDIRGIP